VGQGGEAEEEDRGEAEGDGRNQNSPVPKTAGEGNGSSGDAGTLAPPAQSPKGLAPSKQAGQESAADADDT
jgi:hypothetical protein